MTIPESVTELYLFVDHDAGGDLAVEKAYAHFQMQGRTIHPIKPQIPGDDWNDELARVLAV